MRIVSVKLPEAYIEAIDELVRMGIYTSRSEAIRAAIREMIKRELWSSKSNITEMRNKIREKGKRKRMEVIDID
ncbi:MAG: ribbon-helix-helix domain-containing protein [Desulfurococcaceae archaeon]